MVRRVRPKRRVKSTHYIGEARYACPEVLLSSFPFHSSVQVGANDVNPEAFTTVILRGGEILRRGTTLSSLLGESESFDSVSINTTHQKTLHTSFFFPFHLFIPVSNNLTDPLLFELGLPSKD
jgi:hypothetical protein